MLIAWFGPALGFSMSRLTTVTALLVIVINVAVATIATFVGAEFAI